MTVTAPAPTQLYLAARPASLPLTLRFEMAKLLAQWRVRIVLATALVAPGGFVATVSGQNTLPTDTVFGRWMPATGWAGSLVVLGFCCTWALPLLTALVAGDVFATEDRLGTWRHLVMAVRSPRRIFVAKATASITVIAMMVLALATSSIVGGLLVAGSRALVGLDGLVIEPLDAAQLVFLAWAYVAVATLAFAAVGLLGSVALGRSPMGLFGPALLALLLQLVQLLPLPVALRLALPSQPFLAWRGLFTTPVQTGPLVVGLVVNLAWTVVVTALAYRLFMRRDFTDIAYDGSGRRTLVAVTLPVVTLVVLTVAAISLATPGNGSGIAKGEVEQSIATSFAHLYRLQSSELHRPEVTEAQLRTSASCDKGGSLVEDQGPGSDWRCVVSWHIPGAVVIGSAIYQLDVAADGQYAADGDGPNQVNGYFPVATATGDTPNPLWQIDGLVDLLPSPSKG